MGRSGRDGGGRSGEPLIHRGHRRLRPLRSKHRLQPDSSRPQDTAWRSSDGAPPTTDKLIVRLDPCHDHLDDVWFEVNPSGCKGEQFNGDPSWDPVWEAASHVGSLGPAFLRG